MYPLTYYVDESIKKSDGDDICALIAIKTIDPMRLIALIKDSISGIIADPVLSGHNGINREWIPHYCNDHPIEVHSRFLRDVSQMPFEAYIVFGKKKNFPLNNEYDWYDNLLKVLFTFRLSADKGYMSEVYYEQHCSKIRKRETSIRELFRVMIKKDLARRSAAPFSLKIQSAGKETLPLCLPDYIGGSFMSYLCESDEIKLGPKRREFRLISNKVRWIKDVDTGKIYTTRNPFQKD